MASKFDQSDPQPSSIVERNIRSPKNVFHKIENPGGVVPLGVEGNTLMLKELSEFLTMHLKITPENFECDSLDSALTTGLVKLYNNAPFNPVIPVETTHMHFTAVYPITLIEGLLSTLCDEGGGILLGRSDINFTNHMNRRWNIKFVNVNLKDVNPLTLEAVSRYEERVVQSEQEGTKIRLLYLQNPLVQCYSREIMMEYLRLCQKHHIHFLSDESDALATYSTDDIPNPTRFASLLSIDKTSIIDPSLCHVIHGIGKDFCSYRVRGSTLISQANPGLLEEICRMRPSHQPCMDSLTLSTILNNSKFLSYFLKLHSERLEDRYEFCTIILKIYEIPYGRSTAGNYVWIDLSKHIDLEQGDSTLDGERSLSNRLINGGIHLTPVDAFPGGQTGWFRINMAIDMDALEVGLARMLTVIGLKSSTEDDKLWWRKESYVRANELLKSLFEEYMISRFVKRFSSKSKGRASKDGIAIELEPDGGIKSKIFLSQTVVSVL